MDFQRFGIDHRLLDSSEGLRARAIFHEEVLTHVLEKSENICARIILGTGREEVYLLPYLQTLATSAPGASEKALVIVPERGLADKVGAAARRLGKELALEVCIVTEEAGGEGQSIGGLVLEGSSAASLVIGLPEALIAAVAAEQINLRDYGWLIADGLEHIAEMPVETLRKLASLLLPSWERRSILVCERLTAKAKNLASDLADNPCEIQIDEDAIKAQSMPRETWHVPVESKFKFLLNLIGQEKPERLCIFCNLRSTAEEVSRRLEINALRSDYILGALSPERKSALLGKARRGELSALVLTDEGARGLAPGAFPLVVNYDIPLEPEYFVTRLEMIDRDSPRAKLVNMVCDRYVFGLTAVEQFIGAKLDAAPADQSQYAVDDLSEGQSFEARGNEGRVDELQRRPGLTRPEGRSNGETRGRADSRSRNPRSRDDRSPDIRRSIAEATGGSLDMDGSGQRKPQEPRRDARTNPREVSGRGGQKGRDPRRQETRSEARKPDEGRPAGNPYDLPMEERMRRYREKYGRRMGAERPEGSRQTATPAKGGQGGRAASRREGQQPGAGALRPGQQRRREGPIRREAPAPKTSRSNPPSGELRKGGIAAPSQGPKKGFLDRLRGALRKRGN